MCSFLKYKIRPAHYSFCNNLWKKILGLSQWPPKISRRLIRKLQIHNHSQISRHRSLSLTRQIQSIHSQVSLISIYMYLPTYAGISHVVSFIQYHHSILLPKILYSFFNPPMLATSDTHLILLDFFFFRHKLLLGLQFRPENICLNVTNSL